MRAQTAGAAAPARPPPPRGDGRSPHLGCTTGAAHPAAGVGGPVVTLTAKASPGPRKR